MKKPYRDKLITKMYLWVLLACSGTLCSSEFHMKLFVFFTFSANWAARTLVLSRHSASFSELRRSMLIKSTVLNAKNSDILIKSLRIQIHIVLQSVRTHHKSQRDCSSVDMDVQELWSRSPCLWLDHSRRLSQRRATPPGQTAERCLSVVGAPREGPDGSLGPDETGW